MLKLIFLQRLKNLSDREVVEEASYNLAYKFFLDLSPEEKICDPSLLYKFRRKHIATEYQLKQLLNGILGQAAEKGLLK
ncbi:transposase, partial [Hungatella sp. SL.1.14]|uniref:transposase n=1 Tax=Hungatella sp. SL.1.14 TaxID=2963703 RepID=UPI00210DAA9C